MPNLATVDFEPPKTSAMVSKNDQPRLEPLDHVDKPEPECVAASFPFWSGAARMASIRQATAGGDPSESASSTP